MGKSHPDTPHCYVIRAALVLRPSFVHEVGVNKKEGKVVQNADGRIILRWIFRNWEGVAGTGWSWLRIGTGGGHL